MIPTGRTVLEVALMFAAKSKRGYLAPPILEAVSVATDAVRATDSHGAITIASAIGAGIPAPRRVTREEAERIVKVAEKDALIAVSTERIAESGTGFGIALSEADGTWLDEGRFAALFPDTTDREAVYVSARYLKRVADAASRLGGPDALVGILPAETRPATSPVAFLIDTPTSEKPLATVVQMPVRRH